jgi:hypothetical protein
VSYTKNEIVLLCVAPWNSIKDTMPLNGKNSLEFVKFEVLNLDLDSKSKYCHNFTQKIKFCISKPLSLFSRVNNCLFRSHGTRINCHPVVCKNIRMLDSQIISNK